MIVLHAYINVHPEERERFLELADGLMSGSKAEEGNISYHLYEDTKNPNAFVMLEEWKDMEAVKFHNETPHYRSFKESAKDVVTGPTRVVRFDVTEKHE